MSFGITTNPDGELVVRQLPIDYLTALPGAGEFIGHLVALTTGAIGLYSWNGSAWIGPFGAGGGGGAPTGASYLVLGLDGTLTAERVLTAGVGVNFVDGGANGALTINAPGAVTPTGTGFPHVTAGVLDAAAKLVDTADVNNDQITYPKMQNVSAESRLLGRGQGAGVGDVQEIEPTGLIQVSGTTLIINLTAGSKLAGRSAGSGGPAQQISLGAGLGMTGSVLETTGLATNTPSFVVLALTADLTDERALAVGAGLSLVDAGANANVTLDRAALTGDVTAAAGSNATSIAAGAVDTPELADGAVTLAKHANNSVDNAKLAQMLAGTVKGRAPGAGTGDPTDITLSGTAGPSRVPYSKATGVEVAYLEPHSAQALLVTNASLTAAWKAKHTGPGVLRTKADGTIDWSGTFTEAQIQFAKADGDDVAFVQIGRTGSFPGIPYNGQFCYRYDLHTWFFYSASAAGWLGSEVLEMPFHTIADLVFVATPLYAMWGQSAGIAFTDTFGQIWPYQTKLVGLGVVMNASGTCTLQVTGAGTAIGGTDAISLSSQSKKSTWATFSTAVAKDTVLGVKLTAGTFEGPGSGTAYFRRFEV
jgi:hypothetical protein